MKVDKVEGSAQRRILIGMVTDRTTLARLASRWDGNDGLFSSPHENTVAGWCVKYFRKSICTHFPLVSILPAFQASSSAPWVGLRVSILSAALYPAIQARRRSAFAPPLPRRLPHSDCGR